MAHFAELKEKTDWGAQDITKEMFINADGTPKKIEEIQQDMKNMDII